MIMNENIISTDDNFFEKSSSSQISNTDHTDLTSIPTDISISDDDIESISESKKSVRFSIVNIREYELDELGDEYYDDDDYENKGANEQQDQGQEEEHDTQLRRESLGWSYTDKSSTIETHLEESKIERKKKYALMIQQHIIRAEQEKKDRENKQKEEALRKRKGFRNKVLKPIWKGFVEASKKSALVTPSPI